MSSIDRFNGFRIIVIVLGVIGTIALLCVAVMALMHDTFMGGYMMSGMGR